MNVWEMAVKVAEEVGGLVLPVLPYGCSEEHFPRAGTISLKAETLKQVLGDIARSLARNGVEKMVLLNGHAGQCELVEELAQNLRKEGLNVHHLCPFTVLPTEVLAREIPLEEEIFVHAEELETSLMLAVCPERVKMDKAAKETPEWLPRGLTTANLQAAARVFSSGKSIGGDTATGVIGDPTLASREKGEKALQLMVRALVEAVRKL
jgi:creatinine amidohydrolase